eukprot:UN06246
MVGKLLKNKVCSTEENVKIENPLYKGDFVKFKVLSIWGNS